MRLVPPPRPDYIIDRTADPDRWKLRAGLVLTLIASVGLITSVGLIALVVLS